MSDVTAGLRGHDLFIVDNSVSGWNGLRYLEEWTEIAKAFDIATGHFEIGALLALDGKWQQLGKIRILMGADTNHRTRKAILDAVRKRAVEALDNSVERRRTPTPFSTVFLQFLQRFSQVKLSAAYTIAINFMQKPTSPTRSLRSLGHRPS